MLENNVKNLIKILEESNVDELEITTFWGKQTIRIRKNASSSTEKNIEFLQDATTLPLQSTSKPREAADEEPVPELEQIEPTQIHDEIALINDEKTVTIKAPLVGTFYTASKPGAMPFISEGNTIREGKLI